MHFLEDEKKSLPKILHHRPSLLPVFVFYFLFFIFIWSGQLAECFVCLFVDLQIYCTITSTACVQLQLLLYSYNLLYSLVL